MLRSQRLPEIEAARNVRQGRCCNAGNTWSAWEWDVHWLRPQLPLALAFVVLAGGLVTAAFAQTRPEPRPCPCLPNVKEFGYFHRTWRQWPGEQRPEVINPRSPGSEVLPRPEPQEELPLPPATAPRAPAATPEAPAVMPRTSILPPDTTPAPTATPPESRGTPAPTTTPIPAITPKGDATPGLNLPGLPGLPAEEELPPATAPRAEPPSGSRPSPEAAPAGSQPTSQKGSTPPTDAPKTKTGRPQDSIQLSTREPAQAGEETGTAPELVAPKPTIAESQQPATVSRAISRSGQGELHPQATPLADASRPRLPRAVETGTPAGHSAASKMPSESSPTAVAAAPKNEVARTQVVSPIEDLKPERNKNLSNTCRVDPIPVAASSHLLRKIESSAIVDKALLAEPAGEPAKSESVDRTAATPGKVDSAVRQVSDEEEIVVPPVGLGGYCPVELVLNGRWVQGDLRFTVVHQGLIFRFSGAEQRKQFLADCERFMPVQSGRDVVTAVDENRAVSGETAYCAIYQGRLYMFSSAASQSKFNQNPTLYAVK